MTPSNTPRALSKSKLVAFRQCPKRLWLEVHQPEAREDSSATQAIFRTGHEVGAVAQHIYDPTGEGAVIDLQAEGITAAIDRTRLLLQTPKPVFEAGFTAEGALAFADVMLPIRDGAQVCWRMVEVKSSTSVKTYQEDDVAIQSFAARAAGIDLRSVAIAHIDSTWVYQGDGDYSGLLIEKNMTEGAFARTAEVKTWITEAQLVAAQTQPPDIQVGEQCEKPFPCGFRKHCDQGIPEAQFPVAWLPRIQSKALKDFLAAKSAPDMREIPDVLLTEKQRRVRDVTISGQTYFDAALESTGLPAPRPCQSTRALDRSLDRELENSSSSQTNRFARKPPSQGLQVSCVEYFVLLAMPMQLERLKFSLPHSSS